MEPKPKRSLADILTSLLMMISGILLTLLPIVAWPNSKLFAVLYSPGLLLGPLLVYGGAICAWDEIRGRGDAQVR